MTIFAKRLKERRIHQGVTSQEMADALGLKLRAYQYYESAEREPNIAKLVIIANMLHTSIDYLTGRIDHP